MIMATLPRTARSELAEMRAELAAQAELLVKIENRLLTLHKRLGRGFMAERAMFLSGLAAKDGRHSDPVSLTRFYGQVYSQNGEDGMIAEIFRRIVPQSKYFVEIGIESGLQCNTRLLLESGWQGLWVEGNPESAEYARQLYQPFIDTGALSLVSSKIGPDNIDEVMDRAGVPDSFDFLSLDIDQHTHVAWRALRRRARVACIEYNASIPPSAALEVPFVPDWSWDGSNWFGAGLKTMELIGSAKGLALVGCDLSGTNAFFVVLDEAEGKFRAPFTAERHFEPPSYHLLGHAGHPASPMPRSWAVAAEAVQVT